MRSAWWGSILAEIAHLIDREALRVARYRSHEQRVQSAIDWVYRNTGVYPKAIGYAAPAVRDWRVPKIPKLSFSEALALSVTASTYEVLTVDVIDVRGLEPVEFAFVLPGGEWRTNRGRTVD